jgi:hypothetical protein
MWILHHHHPPPPAGPGFLIFSLLSDVFVCLCFVSKSLSTASSPPFRGLEAVAPVPALPPAPRCLRGAEEEGSSSSTGGLKIRNSWSCRWWWGWWWSIHIDERRPAEVFLLRLGQEVDLVLPVLLPRLGQEADLVLGLVLAALLPRLGQEVDLVLADLRLGQEVALGIRVELPGLLLLLLVPVHHQVALVVVLLLLLLRRHRQVALRDLSSGRKDHLPFLDRRLLPALVTPVPGLLGLGAGCTS